MSCLSSLKPGSPYLVSLSHQQRLSPDEDVKGAGRASSNNSSFFSSIDSPSDRTTVTNLQSPSPRRYGTKHSLPGLPWPADLLETLRRTISVLWQIRSVGPVICQSLDHLDHFIRQDPPRIELPLGHAEHAWLRCLLRLGANPITDPHRDLHRAASAEDEAEKAGQAGRAGGARSPDKPQGKTQGKFKAREDTDVLRSAAIHIIWALANTCVSGVQKQCLDIDLASQNVGLASQSLLEDLGRWILQKLRIEYDYEEAVFIVRMPFVLHDKSSHDVAECLLVKTRQATGDTNLEAPRFTNCALPLSIPVENTPESDDEELGVAPKGSYFHPDAAIFDGSASLPGLILELGWSHPTHRKRAKKYIRNGNGHIRCVLLLNIDYREPKTHIRPELLSPPEIFLTAFTLDADEDSWGVKQYIENWDLRANIDDELVLPGHLISEHISADTNIRVPLRTLVDKIDIAMELHYRIESRVVEPASNDVFGKRKRTESPDDDDENAAYQPGEGDASPARRTRSCAAPVRPERAVARSMSSRAARSGSSKAVARSRSSKRRKGV